MSIKREGHKQRTSLKYGKLDMAIGNEIKTRSIHHLIPDL